MNFLFFIYLIGIVLAVFQDFKRREIDNWLNVFLLFSGVLFVFLFENVSIGNFGFFLFICAGISVLLNYSRIFAGGDAKLLFAIAPYFYSSQLDKALANFGIFILILVLAGSVYGLIYALSVFFKNFSKVRRLFLGNLKKGYSKVILSFILVLFIFGFFDSFLFIVSGFLLFFLLLIGVAFSLEGGVFYFALSSSNVCCEDVLVKDVRVGNKTFRAFKKLSEEDVDFLNGRNIKVFIKDGIPYAFAFLIAFILNRFKDSLFALFFQQGF